MTSRRYIVCPRRPGSPRVAEAVCRACAKNRRCPAWRQFLCPPLFPNLYQADRRA